MNMAFKGFFLGSTISVLTACSGGGGDTANSSRVAGGVRFGQIGSNVPTLFAAASPKWGDAKLSAGSYSWAKVDGLKLEVVSIHGVANNENHSFIDYPEGKLLEVGGDSGAIKFTDDITVPTGDYSDIGIRFNNKFIVKAFCRTSDGGYYTTATGVKKCSVDCDADKNLPSDYDYYNPGKLLPDPYYENVIIETNKLNFSVVEGSTPNLTLLVDTSYAVSCAGTSATMDVDGEANKLPPFVWKMSTGKFSDYYKGTEGNFAIGYIPIFTYLSTSVDEAVPVGETYATSASSTDIPDGNETFNFVTSLITTIAFNESGEMIAARSRANGHAHGTELNQGWSGLSKTDNSYTMLNGEAYIEGQRWFQDRKIEGFVRSTDFTTRQTLQVVDGPDCGKKLNDRNQECRSSPISSYWKRISR